MTHELTRDEILALLDWQRAMGADAVVGDMPIDWLERGGAAPGSTFHWPDRGPPSVPALGEPSPALKPLSLQPAPVAGPSRPATVARPAAPALIEPRADLSRPQTPLAPSAAETEARRVATAAHSLEALEAALRAFDGCALKATATNLCFYRGAPQAPLMLIGEAPGRDEDIEGKPFVGRAGQLLDKMLAAIGMTEADVHIANIVYWRPPGNRTPTPQEALACRPFLERQMILVKPRLVVALGGAAAKEVLGAQEGIMRLRGKWRDIEIAGARIPAVATLHPAYLLRTPAAKQLAWQDLLAIKSKLAATA